MKINVPRSEGTGLHGVVQDYTQSKDYSDDSSFHHCFLLVFFFLLHLNVVLIKNKINNCSLAKVMNGRRF